MGIWRSSHLPLVLTTGQFLTMSPGPLLAVPPSITAWTRSCTTFFQHNPTCYAILRGCVPSVWNFWWDSRSRDWKGSSWGDERPYRRDKWDLSLSVSCCLWFSVSFCLCLPLSVSMSLLLSHSLFFSLLLPPSFPVSISSFLFPCTLWGHNKEKLYTTKVISWHFKSEMQFS